MKACIGSIALGMSILTQPAMTQEIEQQAAYTLCLQEPSGQERKYTIEFSSPQQLAEHMLDMKAWILETVENGEVEKISAVWHGDLFYEEIVAQDIQQFRETLGFRIIGRKPRKRFAEKPVYHACMPKLASWGDSAPADVSTINEQTEPFFSLALSAEDKKNIRKLLVAMSDKGPIQLFLEKDAMDTLGDRIRPVHPLRFIGFILADPYLARCLTRIASDLIKWSYFSTSYAESMQQAAMSDDLLLYAPGLAELLHADLAEVEQFLLTENYVGLLQRYLGS